MSTPDFAKPWFMNWGGTPPIVIIWYLAVWGLLIQGWHYLKWMFQLSLTSCTHETSPPNPSATSLCRVLAPHTWGNKAQEGTTNSTRSPSSPCCWPGRVSSVSLSSPPAVSHMFTWDLHKSPALPSAMVEVASGTWPRWTEWRVDANGCNHGRNLFHLYELIFALTHALEGGSSHKISPNLFRWVHPVYSQMHRLALSHPWVMSEKAAAKNVWVHICPPEINISWGRGREEKKKQKWMTFLRQFCRSHCPSRLLGWFDPFSPAAFDVWMNSSAPPALSRQVLRRRLHR